MSKRYSFIVEGNDRKQVVTNFTASACRSTQTGGSPARYVAELLYREILRETESAP
jgi:hypothetical protein